MGRLIGIAVFGVGLSVVLTACASEPIKPAAEKSSAGAVRYYGGPKSPMATGQ